MATATKMSLADFGPATIWFTSVGCPTGETIDLSEVDDPRDAESMVPFDWDLEGSVDEDGEWAWDGNGTPSHCGTEDGHRQPSDWGNNTVYTIRAFRA